MRQSEKHDAQEVIQNSVDLRIFRRPQRKVARLSGGRFTPTTHVNGFDRRFRRAGVRCHASRNVRLLDADCAVFCHRFYCHLATLSVLVVSSHWAARRRGQHPAGVVVPNPSVDADRHGRLLEGGGQAFQVLVLTASFSAWRDSIAVA